MQGKKRLNIHPYLLVGGLLVLIPLIAAIFAPLLTSYDPVAINSADRLMGPSSRHLLGTDELGRDILSRVLFGARYSFFIGLMVVLLSTLVGCCLGSMCAYFPKVDIVVFRIIEGIIAFPVMVIAIVMATIWGGGMFNLILALVFGYFPNMTLIVRSTALTIKKMGYVESVEAAGAKNIYIILKYILPNAVSPIIVQATFTFAAAIISEASLSFLGVGVEASTPTWGGMINFARTNFMVAPWTMLAPALMMVITILGLNLLGDGLRDELDPKLKV